MSRSGRNVKLRMYGVGKKTILSRPNRWYSTLTMRHMRGFSTYHIRTIRVHGKLVMQGLLLWYIVGHDDKGLTLPASVHAKVC
jgi:hypothetical protein